MTDEVYGKPLSRCICRSDILVRFACDLFQPWTLIADYFDSFTYFDEHWPVEEPILRVVTRNTMVSPPVDKRSNTHHNGLSTRGQT